jgi:hypothetical protein
MLPLFSMEGSMDQCYRIPNVIAAATTFLLVASAHATAQQPCLLYQEGTVGCPVFGAPAATAVPGPSMADGLTLQYGTSTTLFGGQVPPNGFLIRVFGLYGGTSQVACFVTDHGQAGSGIGFYMVGDNPNNIGLAPSATFASPYGYKPMGPVSIWCGYTGSVPPNVSFAARGW